MTAFVQEFDAHNTGTSLAGATIPGTTAGNALIWAIFSNFGATVSAQACSGESVSTAISVANDTGQGTLINCGFIKSLAGSGSKTITANFSTACNWGFSIIEVSGQDTATFVEANTALDQLATNIQYSVTVTSLSAGAMILVWACSTNSDPVLISGGYSTGVMVNGPASSEQLTLYAYDNDGGAAGLKTITYDAIGVCRTLQVAVALKNFAVANVLPSLNDAVTVAESVTPNVVNMPKVFNKQAAKDLWEKEKNIWTRSPVIYRPA